MTDRVEGTEERDAKVYDLAARLQAELGDHNSASAEFRTIRRSSGEKWAGVEEPIPSEIKTVLILFTDEGFRCWSSFGERVEQVTVPWANKYKKIWTHWQPLPAPPDSGDKKGG